MSFYKQSFKNLRSKKESDENDCHTRGFPCFALTEFLISCVIGICAIVVGSVYFNDQCTGYIVVSMPMWLLIEGIGLIVVGFVSATAFMYRSVNYNTGSKVLLGLAIILQLIGYLAWSVVGFIIVNKTVCTHTELAVLLFSVLQLLPIFGLMIYGCVAADSYD